MTMLVGGPAHGVKITISPEAVGLNIYAGCNNHDLFRPSHYRPVQILVNGQKAIIYAHDSLSDIEAENLWKNAVVDSP